ncbi:MAG: hypothetical protein AAF564_03680 [Bacteroidota bacterium]
MKTHTSAYKYAFGLLIACSLFIIWMNLAVGIIGDSDDPANLMYVGVLAIGLVGALMVRFKPIGMMYTAFVMAKFLVIVPIVAIGMGRHLDGSTPPLATFIILHLVFIACLFVAGLCFRRAAAEERLSDR